MQPPSGGFRLIVRRGPQPNQIYELNKDVITLGRDITNDITINDPEVSRHHARLSRQPDGGFVMEDLGSTNGTFINGQRLTGGRPLVPGETIGLGETVTLAYESTAFVAPAQPQYAPPAQPQYAPPGQPQYQQAPAQPAPPPPPQRAPMYDTPPPVAPSPYAQPGVGYAPPPQTMYSEQPPSPYGYVEEEPRGGMTRWLLLGCGCFIVLCVLGSVIGLIAVDLTCSWKEEPLASIVETLGYEPSDSVEACQ